MPKFTDLNSLSISDKPFEAPASDQKFVPLDSLARITPSKEDILNNPYNVTKMNKIEGIGRYLNSSAFPTLGYSMNDSDIEQKYFKATPVLEQLGNAAAQLFGQAGAAWDAEFSKLEQVKETIGRPSAEYLESEFNASEALREKYPVFKSSDEVSGILGYIPFNGSSFSKWTNFIPNIGFTLGTAGGVFVENLVATAIIEAATGGTATPLAGANIIKSFYEAGKDIIKFRNFATLGKTLANTTKLYGSAGNILRAGEALKAGKSLNGMLHGLYGSYALYSNTAAEALVENANSVGELVRDLKNDFIEKNGREPNGDELSKMQTAAEGLVLPSSLGNISILMASNFLQQTNAFKAGKSLSSLAYSGSKILGKQLEKRMVLDQATGLMRDATSKELRNQMVKSGLSSALSILSEGVEESAQGIVSKATQDFQKAKYYDKPLSWTDSLGAGFTYAMSDEGLEEFSAGIVTGSLFTGGGSLFNKYQGKIDRAKLKQQTGKTFEETVKSEITNFNETVIPLLKYNMASSKSMDNLKYQSVLAERINQAKEKGDGYAVENYKNAGLVSAMITAKYYGKDKVLLDYYKELADLERSDLAKYFNSSEEELDSKEEFAKTIQKLERISELVDIVSDRYKNKYQKTTLADSKYSELGLSEHEQEFIRDNVAFESWQAAQELLVQQLFASEQIKERISKATADLSGTNVSLDLLSALYTQTAADQKETERFEKANPEYVKKREKYEALVSRQQEIDLELDSINESLNTLAGESKILNSQKDEGIIIGASPKSSFSEREIKSLLERKNALELEGEEIKKGFEDLGLYVGSGKRISRLRNGKEILELQRKEAENEKVMSPEFERDEQLTDAALNYILDLKNKIFRAEQSLSQMDEKDRLQRQSIKKKEQELDQLTTELDIIMNPKLTVEEKLKQINESRPEGSKLVFNTNILTSTDGIASIQDILDTFTTLGYMKQDINYSQNVIELLNGVDKMDIYSATMFKDLYDARKRLLKNIKEDITDEGNIIPGLRDLEKYSGATPVKTTTVTQTPTQAAPQVSTPTVETPAPAVTTAQPTQKPTPKPSKLAGFEKGKEVYYNGELYTIIDMPISSEGRIEFTIQNESGTISNVKVDELSLKEEVEKQSVVATETPVEKKENTKDIKENLNEIEKLVITDENYNNWSNVRDKSDYEAFVDQVRSTLAMFDRVQDKSTITAENVENSLASVKAFSNKEIRDKVVPLIVNKYAEKSVEKKEEPTSEIETKEQEQKQKEEPIVNEFYNTPETYEGSEEENINKLQEEEEKEVKELEDYKQQLVDLYNSLVEGTETEEEKTPTLEDLRQAIVSLDAKIEEIKNSYKDRRESVRKYFAKNKKEPLGAGDDSIEDTVIDNELKESFEDQANRIADSIIKANDEGTMLLLSEEDTKFYSDYKSTVDDIVDKKLGKKKIETQTKVKIDPQVGFIEAFNKFFSFGSKLDPQEANSLYRALDKIKYSIVPSWFKFKTKEASIELKKSFTDLSKSKDSDNKLAFPNVEYKNITSSKTGKQSHRLLNAEEAESYKSFALFRHQHSMHININEGNAKEIGKILFEFINKYPAYALVESSYSLARPDNVRIYTRNSSLTQGQLDELESKLKLLENVDSEPIMFGDISYEMLPTPSALRDTINLMESEIKDVVLDYLDINPEFMTNLKLTYNNGLSLNSLEAAKLFAKAYAEFKRTGEIKDKSIIEPIINSQLKKTKLYGEAKEIKDSLEGPDFTNLMEEDFFKQLIKKVEARMRDLSIFDFGAHTLTINQTVYNATTGAEATVINHTLLDKGNNLTVSVTIKEGTKELEFTPFEFKNKYSVNPVILQQSFEEQKQSEEEEAEKNDFNRYPSTILTTISNDDDILYGNAEIDPNLAIGRLVLQDIEKEESDYFVKVETPGFDDETSPFFISSKGAYNKNVPIAIQDLYREGKLKNFENLSKEDQEELTSQGVQPFNKIVTLTNKDGEYTKFGKDGTPSIDGIIPMFFLPKGTLSIVGDQIMYGTKSDNTFTGRILQPTSKIAEKTNTTVQNVEEEKRKEVKIIEDIRASKESVFLKMIGVSGGVTDGKDIINYTDLEKLTKTRFLLEYPKIGSKVKKGTLHLNINDNLIPLKKKGMGKEIALGVLAYLGMDPVYISSVHGYTVGPEILKAVSKLREELNKTKNKEKRNELYANHLEQLKKTLYLGENGMFVLYNRIVSKSNQALKDQDLFEALVFPEFIKDESGNVRKVDKKTFYINNAYKFLYKKATNTDYYEHLNEVVDFLSKVSFDASPDFVNTNKDINFVTEDDVVTMKEVKTLPYLLGTKDKDGNTIIPAKYETRGIIVNNSVLTGKNRYIILGDSVKGPTITKPAKETKKVTKKRRVISEDDFADLDYIDVRNNFKPEGEDLEVLKAEAIEKIINLKLPDNEHNAALNEISEATSVKELNTIIEKLC